MNTKHHTETTETGNAEPNAPARKTSEDYDQDLTGQYIRLPMAFILDRKAGKLGRRDIYLYCFLLAKQGENKSSYWGLASLKRMTGLSETGIKQSLRALVKSGHIERKRGNPTSHTICRTKVESDAKGTRIFIKGQLATTHINKNTGGDAPKPPEVPLATPPPRIASDSDNELDEQFFDGQFASVGFNAHLDDVQNEGECPADIIHDSEPDVFRDCEQTENESLIQALNKPAKYYQEV